MEHYITHGLRTYSPKNKKASDLLAMIKRYDNIIIQDRIGLDAFVNECRAMVERVNEKYPKIKAIVFNRRGDEHDRHCVIEAFVPGANTDLNQGIYSLVINRAAGIYYFNEKLCTELTENNQLPLC